jgi:hypothetical protein
VAIFVGEGEIPDHAVAVAVCEPMQGPTILDLRRRSIPDRLIVAVVAHAGTSVGDG